MRSEVTYRSPCEDDLDAIAALEAVSFDSPWKREFFAGELNAVGRFNLVIVAADDLLIGYLFTMYYLDELHVNKIAVDVDWRRCGLASALMDRCFAFAKENELRMVSLEVRESNSAARGLYGELGFTESYLRPRYYPEGESAVVMVRDLEEKREERREKS